MPPYSSGTMRPQTPSAAMRFSISRGMWSSWSQRAADSGDASLSMKDREDGDGEYDDGFLPLVWVSGDAREVLGEIEAKDLLDLIDKEVAKKPKAVN